MVNYLLNKCTVLLFLNNMIIYNMYNIDNMNINYNNNNNNNNNNN